MTKKGKGWHHESHRHSLAARGISTKVNTKTPVKTINKNTSNYDSLLEKSIRIHGTISAEEWAINSRIGTPWLLPDGTILNSKRPHNMIVEDWGYEKGMADHLLEEFTEEIGAIQVRTYSDDALILYIAKKPTEEQLISINKMMNLMKYDNLDLLVWSSKVERHDKINNFKPTKLFMWCNSFDWSEV